MDLQGAAPAFKIQRIGGGAAGSPSGDRQAPKKPTTRAPWAAGGAGGAVKSFAIFDQLPDGFLESVAGQPLKADIIVSDGQKKAQLAALIGHAHLHMLKAIRVAEHGGQDNA